MKHFDRCTNGIIRVAMQYAYADKKKARWLKEERPFVINGRFKFESWLGSQFISICIQFRNIQPASTTASSSKHTWMINHFRNFSKFLWNGINIDFIFANVSLAIAAILIWYAPSSSGKRWVCPHRKVRVTELTSILQPIRNVDTIKIKLFVINVFTILTFQLITNVLKQLRTLFLKQVYHLPSQVSTSYCCDLHVERSLWLTGFQFQSLHWWTSHWSG